MLVGIELAGEELGDNIVNVEQQSTAPQTRRPGREDQEIRYVVDVHKVVPPVFARCREPVQ